jgi:hypothetical protein
MPRIEIRGYGMKHPSGVMYSVKNKDTLFSPRIEIRDDGIKYPSGVIGFCANAIDQRYEFSFGLSCFFYRVFFEKNGDKGVRCLCILRNGKAVMLSKS